MMAIYLTNTDEKKNVSDDDPDIFSSKHHLFFILKETLNHTTVTFDFCLFIPFKLYIFERRAVKRQFWYRSQQPCANGRGGAWMGATSHSMCFSHIHIKLFRMFNNTFPSSKGSSRILKDLLHLFFVQEHKENNIFWIYIFSQDDA